MNTLSSYSPLQQFSLTRYGRLKMRPLARDYERHPATSEAMIRWGAINDMVRRLSRGRLAARQRAWTLEDIKA
ncbi:MAG TPA: hypothetical protein VFB50_00030 [Chloroflexota bacterium]|nr:hypothetical protein [Chloroflexota bacterium]